LDIRFPIYVRAKDCGDIKTYNSVCDLQSDVEKTDVENEEYEAWDTNGMSVRLEVQNPVWLRTTPVPSAILDRSHCWSASPILRAGVESMFRKV